MPVKPALCPLLVAYALAAGIHLHALSSRAVRDVGRLGALEHLGAVVVPQDAPEGRVDPPPFFGGEGIIVLVPLVEQSPQEFARFSGSPQVIGRVSHRSRSRRGRLRHPGGPLRRACVDLQRYAGGLVAGQAGHLRQAQTGSVGTGNEGVTQVVRADRLPPSTFRPAFSAALTTARRALCLSWVGKTRASGAIRANDFAACAFRSGTLVHDGGRHGHDGGAAGGLERHARAARSALLLDVQRPGGEVYVCPCQAQRFGDAQPHVGAQAADAPVGRAQVGQQRVELSGRKYAALLGRLRPRLRAARQVTHGVALDQLPLRAERGTADSECSSTPVPCSPRAPSTHGVQQPPQVCDSSAAASRLPSTGETCDQ